MHPFTAHWSNMGLLNLELSGSYLSDGQLKDPARHASGTENATKLWNLGEAILGQTFEL